MKKTLLTIFSILSIAIGTVSAQKDSIKTASPQTVNIQTGGEFKPSGNMEVLVFTDFNSTTTNSKTLNKFEVTRAYFGYKYNFSRTLSGRATFDVGNPGVGNLAYTAYLKYGYMQYKDNGLTVKFGLIQNTMYEMLESFWGNRYILKVFQDQYGFAGSADFGMSAAYDFNKVISADFMISNGEGYKVLNTDSVLKEGIGVTIHPIKEITLRGYYDNMKKTNSSVSQGSTSLMAGYANKTFNLAAEYNSQVNNKFKSGYDFNGYSVYGTLFFNTKTSVLARYDYLSSKDNTVNANSWNYAKDGSEFLIGFQYAPVKGLRISPNYQLWTPKDGTKSKTSSIFLNVEIKI